MDKNERITKGAKVLRELIDRKDTELYRRWLITFLDMVEDHMKYCKSGGVTFDVPYEEAKKTFTGLIEEEGDLTARD